MLDKILQQSRPGVNPDLEEMIAQLMMGAGGQQGGMPAEAMRQPLPQSTLGAQSSMQGAQAAGLPAEQANQTYQILIRQGVPPELAKQAISDPMLLQDILRQLQSDAAPANQPQMMPNGNNRMSPPAPQRGAQPYRV